MKRKMSALMALVAMSINLLFPTGLKAEITGISYLPDVTAAMSEASYWSEDEELLMTWEEITALNALTISTPATCMYDLKNQPEKVNGIALNEALLSSTQSDVNYYLGWTYLGSETIAEQADFAPLIANTQNPNPSVEQSVQYAIAVRRTELRTFPSPLSIWDDLQDLDFDYQYLTGIRVNEPLVITSVSADGNYYLAKNICCSGWISAEDVAICRDKEEWLSAWDILPDQTLVVYGDKVYTETSVSGKETSALMLSMGTTLKLADIQNPCELIDNRSAFQNYVVWMPVRNEDGSYDQKLTLIPEHAEVCKGYMPLTKKNVVQVALGVLGNTYGWGGGLVSEDCSGYIRSIYKCFGLELARNTTWQAAMPMAGAAMNDMCREERLRFMDALPPGAILYFSGHEMLYLGKENDQHYVISAVGSIMEPWEGRKTQRIRSTIINTLDIKRASGKTWLDSLTHVNVPYWGMLPGKTYSLPAYSWYHEGVAFCLKNSIMQGYADGFFHPEAALTRAHLVQILWNLEGMPEAEGMLMFEDVSGNAWYYDAVQWAAYAGIVQGYNPAVFAPDATITREQLAAILFRYAQYKGMNLVTLQENLQHFTDQNEITSYAIPALNWAVGEEIMTGRSETLLAPLDRATRAETAVVMMKFIKWMEI